jgi:3-hydroxyisobutyrate dehydrogenase
MKSSMTSSLATIAFIGTGLMGTPMARRLLAAGFAVRVWNRTPRKLEALIDAGAEPAASPADAAGGADAVFLCLSNSAAIDAVLFAEQGVARSNAAPPLLADFSTIGQGKTIEFARRLRAQCGTAWVDAPVSGGTVGAEHGRLVIFCGGASADVDRLRPAFQALSQRITHVGDLGAGQTLKLCNQLIVASNLVAIAEALVLARASGLDPTILPGALAGGFADSIPLQIFGRRMAERVTTPVLGELALMLKDLNAAADLAQGNRTALPLMTAALKVYERAASLGLQHEDLAALIAVYDAVSDKPLQPSEP